MPRFMTIGYGDEAHAHDEKLKQGGAVMGIAGLPVQVRNPDAKVVETRTGPYLSSPLPVAGFALIEAANLAEAIQLAQKSPCAVAHGVIEVWPLVESTEGAG